MRRSRVSLFSLLLLVLVHVDDVNAALANRASRRANNKKDKKNKSSVAPPAVAPTASNTELPMPSDTNSPSEPARSGVAASLAARVLATSPKQDLSEQHNVGMALLAEGKHDEAGLAFEAVVNVDPDAADSWSALGLCMNALGQPDAALICQKQVVRIRGADAAGGQTAFMEAQFAQLSADGELPPLPDGRRLSVSTGTLEACETGGRLWTSAIALCEWLGRSDSDLLQGKAVLELGCGTGAVGLYAAAAGAHRVTLSDGGPAAVLELARCNAAANAELWSGGDVTVEVVEYSWGGEWAVCGEFDLVVGSDLTYAAGAHAALCSTLAEQLRQHSSGCRVVLAHEHRMAISQDAPPPDMSQATSGMEAVADTEAAFAAARADDEKLAHLIAAAEEAGLEVRTLHTQSVGERLVSVLEVCDAAAAARSSSVATPSAVAAAPPAAAATTTTPPPPAAPTALADPLTMQRLSALFESSLEVQEPAMWENLRNVARDGALPLRLDEIATSVRASPSARHGVGAFATTALPAWSVASLYPVHSIGIGSQRVSTADDAEIWQEPCSTAYRARILHAAAPAAAATRPVQEWAAGAYVDASPSKPNVDGWLAHVANDAAVCAESTDAAILKYYAACESACNCVMLPLGNAAPLMALVTTRDVESDEELLLAYGHTYWIEHFGGKASDTSPAVARAAAATWGGGGLDAAIARVAAAYANDVKLLEGLLVPAPPGVEEQ